MATPVAAPAAESGDGNSGAARKMITLISSDNARFEVDEAAASLSPTVRDMIAGGAGAGGVTLPGVDSRFLAKVIEYCNKHAPAPATATSCGDEAAGAVDFSPILAAEAAQKKELAAFDEEFINVDSNTLYGLIMAASYLGVEGIVELASQKIADMMKGKTVEGIRQTFGIQNDYTPEEEEEMRKEAAWAFDD
ncbi:hypothetical protein ACP70R_043476 [Stipagrostis hirtigluma subsp. patula]